MIALLMLAATATAALLAVAALAVDRLARLWRLPARNVWSAAIVAALALPAAAIALRPSAASRADGPSAAAAPTLPAGTAVLPPIVVRAGDTMRDQLDAVATRLTPLDRPLAALWLALSAAVLALVLRGVRTLARARAGWRARDVDGERVLVASDVGPAVVGLHRPAIVLPEWALALDAPLRALVLRHEREHVRAGDPRHLALAAAAAVAMPWNAPVWWLGRRLRTALEIDCDARVLAARPDVSRYGLLLLAVAQRRAAPLRALAGAPALAESTSDLSRRIDAMRAPLPRGRALRTALGITAASAAVASAVAACAASRDVLGPRAGARASVADTASVRKLPTVVTTTVDAEGVAFARTQPPADSASAAAARAPRPAAPTVANGPYFEFQVEQPVVPAPGNSGPRYPDSLRVARVTGTVLAQFVVDTNGTVMPGSFKVLRADHKLFADAVRSALYDMRFNPARVGGRSVRQVVQAPFQFELSK